MSKSNELEYLLQKYKEFDVEQLRTMITDNAVPESVEMAALPWKTVRETLEDLNVRTENALERLMSGWEGEAANEFRLRIEKLGSFSRELSVYIEGIERSEIPKLAGYLAEAQSSAESIRGEASEMSYEEWSESRKPWEMNDRLNYENEQKNERLQMAAVVARLASHYSEFSDFISKNPPPLPAAGTPGEHANPPGGTLYEEPVLAPGMSNDGTPLAPATASASTGSIDGPDGTVDTPATPATENPWGLGDGEGEDVGEGLYASTGGAGLGGAPSAPAAPAPTGGAGVGAMGAGAAGLGVAGAGAAAASGSGGAGRPGTGAGAGRPGGPGGTMRPGQGPGAQSTANGAKGGSSGLKSASAAGRPGASAMAGGGRPGESSDEEVADDANWLKESDHYFSHFDPNAGPSDEYDPKVVREWEEMYDRWVELRESGELK